MNDTEAQKPLTSFVTLDTNVLIRIVSQGQPGCEIGHWRDLKSHVESARVVLLMTEVVLLEFEKAWAFFEQKAREEIRACRDSAAKWVPEKSTYSEIRDLRGYLERKVTEYEEEKFRTAKEYRDELLSFFSSSQTVRIPFDERIWFAGKRRVMAGRYGSPSRQKSPESDCYIIESLIRHLSAQSRIRRCQLYICTENVSDFGIDGKERVLDPSIQCDLPPAELYVDLKSLLRAIQAEEEIMLPSYPEVEAAVARAKEMQIEKKLALRQSLTWLNESIAARGLSWDDIRREADRFSDTPTWIMDQLLSEHSLGYLRDPEDDLRGQLIKSTRSEEERDSLRAEGKERQTKMGEANREYVDLRMRGVWPEVRLYLLYSKYINQSD
jgi:hypothetical protein